MHEIDRILGAIGRIAAAGKRGVLVTVVRTAGSTYRRAGARVVIADDGESSGAISGGCLERDLAERIRPWLETMEPRVVTYDSTGPEDLVFGLGLGCRGVLDLLVEPFDREHLPQLHSFRWNGRQPVRWTTRLPDGDELVETVRPQRTVVVFGGGLDVPPVVDLARSLGWQVDVITSREPFDASGCDAAVVMTHNFERDQAILRALLASSVRYIGLLGPASRGRELLEAVGSTGDPRVHSPVGLDLGGETPEEIALSIAAEVQAVLSGRSSRPLREVSGPIHGQGPDPA